MNDVTWFNFKLNIYFSHLNFWQIYHLMLWLNPPCLLFTEIFPFLWDLHPWKTNLNLSHHFTAKCNLRTFFFVPISINRWFCIVLIRGMANRAGLGAEKLLLKMARFSWTSTLNRSKSSNSVISRSPKQTSKLGLAPLIPSIVKTACETENELSLSVCL